MNTVEIILAISPKNQGFGISVIDIIFAVILAFGLIRGLIKGFIVELTSLLALVLGIYGAIHFSYYLVDFLNQFLTWDEKYINITALVLTFIIIVVLISLLGKLFTKLAKLVALGILNRLLGGIFGVLKMAFILSVLIMFFVSFNGNGKLIKTETLEQSVLYPPVKKLAPLVLPSILTEVQNHSDWDGRRPIPNPRNIRGAGSSQRKGNK